MNLGTASLARAGINYLASGFCEEHGLLWTDGRNVNICGIKAVKISLERFFTKTLLQLDHVDSVLWGYRVDGNNRIIAVQCPTSINLYEITKSIQIAGGKKKLDYSVNNCRVINSKPLLNGILWHPFLDILCIISKFFSTIYLNNSKNDKPGSLALDPKFSSENAAPMQCGCWSTEGNYFIIGSSSNIIIYQWENIREKVTEYVVRTFCLDIIETLIIALKCKDERHLICTSRYQLRTRVNDQNYLFELKEKEREENHDPSIIKFEKNEDSLTERLKNLYVTECSNEKYSQILLVDFVKETVLSTFNLNDILTPDILECTNFGCILVSGHASSKVYQFQTTDDNKSIFQSSCLKLNSKERAKGICKVSDDKNQFLLLNATSEEEQPAFQFSILGKYSIKIELLVYQETDKSNMDKCEDNLSSTAPHVSSESVSHSIFIPTSTINSTFEQTYCNSNHMTLKNEIILLQCIFKAASAQPIEANQPVPVPSLSAVSSLSPSVLYYDAPNVVSGCQVFFNENSKSYELCPRLVIGSPLASCFNLQNQKLDNFSLSLSQTEDRTTPSFSGIQDITNDWRESVQTKEESNSMSNASPNEFLESTPRNYQSFDSLSYPSLAAPPIVYVTLHSDKNTITKNFLLDGDKLKYAAVLDVFNLSNLEIMIGTEFCFVSPNLDGYIPLSFESGCQIHITGKRNTENAGNFRR